MAFIPDPDIGQTLRIPVIVRGGEVKFFFGGPIPKLKEGTIGELVVAALAVLDESARGALLEERKVLFIGPREPLYAQIRASVEPNQEGFLKKDPELRMPAGRWEYALIRPEEPLFLQLRGIKAPSLSNVRCNVSEPREEMRQR